MKKDPRFVNSYTDDLGNRISQYDLLKSAADTPEDIKQFEDIELKNLKQKQIRFTDHGFVQDNGFGEAIVKKGNFKDAYKNNRDLRKEVKKILKYDSEVNKFFKAKDIDKYLEFRNKKRKPFEAALDNVKKPIEVKTPDTRPSPSIPRVPLPAYAAPAAPKQETFEQLELPGVPKTQTFEQMKLKIEEKAAEKRRQEAEQFKKEYGDQGLAYLKLEGFVE
jgi:hypothetical protein